MKNRGYNSSFRTYFPVEFYKGKSSTGEEIMLMRGIASTNQRDSDGEFLDPKGFDVSYFLKNGFINWDHQSRTNPSAIIGKPTKAFINPNGDFEVEYRLFSQSEKAKEVFQLAKVLAKEGIQLGLSIEGTAIERDPINYRYVRKARITGLAVTPSPKNLGTVTDIISKGENFSELMEGKDYLTKAEAYGEVFTKFPEIDSESVQNIYKLALDIQNNGEMSRVTREAMNRAYNLLELEKSSSNQEEFSENEDNIFLNDIEDSEFLTNDDLLEVIRKGEEELEFLKSMVDEEDISSETDSSDTMEKGEKVFYKACTYKGENAYMKMKKGKDGDEMRLDDKYYQKGEDGDYYEMSMQGKDDMSKGEGGDEFSSSKSSLVDLIKSQNDELIKSFNDSISGVMEMNKSLQSEIEVLSGRLKEIEETPVGRKSVTTASQANFLDKKFGNDLQKSENGGQTKIILNPKNPRHKREILELMDEVSNLSKGENVDMNLAKSMGVYESSNVLDPSAVKKVIQARPNVVIQ